MQNNNNKQAIWKKAIIIIAFVEGSIKIKLQIRYTIKSSNERKNNTADKK